MKKKTHQEIVIFTSIKFIQNITYIYGTSSCNIHCNFTCDNIHCNFTCDNLFNYIQSHTYLRKQNNDSQQELFLN